MCSQSVFGVKRISDVFSARASVVQRCLHSCDAVRPTTFSFATVTHFVNLVIVSVDHTVSLSLRQKNSKQKIHLRTHSTPGSWMMKLKRSRTWMSYVITPTPTNQSLLVCSDIVGASAGGTTMLVFSISE